MSLNTSNNESKIISFNSNNILNELDSISDNNSSTVKIHIRIKQRTSRKYITTIENISSEYNYQKLLKAMKNKFHCNGSIEKYDDITAIQLFGDQRAFIKQFLINEGIAQEQDIIIHGF